MISGLPTSEAIEGQCGRARPWIGVSTFGATTPALHAIGKRTEGEFDCLVFQATGPRGRSTASLDDPPMLSGVIDFTTTEVSDMLVGGVFAADADRFGAPIRTGLPFSGSLGAMDRVASRPRETAPERFRGRRPVEHNANVALIRATREEIRAISEWMRARKYQSVGLVRILLPQTVVSALDAPCKPFYDPEADRALFDALEATVRQNRRRQIRRIDLEIKDDMFAAAVIAALLSISLRRERRA